MVAVQRQAASASEPGAAEQLFAPFPQDNQTLARSAGGLGIGLTIVRRLAELHGGSVGASSEGPGQGARFVVRLPLAEAPAGGRADERAGRGRHARAGAWWSSRTTTTSASRCACCSTLWGHEVATGRRRADEGSSACLQQRPDVALVDVGLPGMNGYDVARCDPRSASPTARMRLIALTGYGQPADRERALQAGFDAHLLKPIAPEILQRELAR